MVRFPTRISGVQFRAARALLDWTQKEFAAFAGVPLSGIRAVERGSPIAVRYVTPLLEALAGVGIEFVSDEHVCGVVQTGEMAERHYLH